MSVESLSYVKPQASLEGRARECVPFDGSRLEERRARLEKLHAAFGVHHTFTPGMLVRWKDGLRNKSRPRYGEPCIVIRKFEGSVCNNDEDRNSPYFMEPLDMILGLVDELHGEFNLFYFDSRRFEPLPANKK